MHWFTKSICLGALAFAPPIHFGLTVAHGQVADPSVDPLESGVLHLPLDRVDSRRVLGRGSSIIGVKDGGLALDGRSILKVPQSSEISHAPTGFTIVMWVNPFALGRGQQMLLAKNCYSLDQREWSLMLDADGRFRAYIRQGNWKTIEAADLNVQPGRWYQLALVKEATRMKLYVNGEYRDELPLSRPIPKTEAAVTIGGVDDQGRIWQTFWGAMDEVQIYPEAKSAKAIAAGYQPVNQVLKIPSIGPEYRLWGGKESVPKTQELKRVEGTTFHVIKKYEPSVDGYRFLHGVAIAVHRNQLFASFGHNRGAENTGSEEARYAVSTDLGKTWSEPRTIDAGNEDLAVSHGVFHHHEGRLWAYLGAFHGFRQDVHTRAYVYDDEANRWEPRGVVCEDGFWPMQQPLKMGNGRWIMSGLQVGGRNPAAVAISEGDDPLKWRVVVIPESAPGNVWGESTVIVEGSQVLNIARYGARPIALAARSSDGGEHWTKSVASNMPMVTSKPYAGTLSTGQKFLIATTTADSGGRRSPLTIALSEPGEQAFSRVLEIRPALFDEGVGESHKNAALAYPYAVEHKGRLYVAYSNNGGGVGRAGEPRSRANNNSAELAVIPLSELQ